MSKDRYKWVHKDMYEYNSETAVVAIENHTEILFYIYHVRMSEVNVRWW